MANQLFPGVQSQLAANGEDVFFHVGDGLHYVNPEFSYDMTCATLRCLVSDCPGMALWTAENGLNLLSPHNHLPSPLFPAQLTLRRRILLRIESGDQSSYRTIYDEECSDFPVAVQARVPWKHIYPEMKAARVTLYGDMPKNLNDVAAAFAVPPYNLLSATLDGGDNVMSKFITTSDGDILIFCSCRNAEFLNCVSEVVCTTESLATNFKLQLLVLVGKHRGYALPLVYCMIENCTLQSYRSVLLHLKEVSAQFFPRLVITSYDSGLKQAWNMVFPSATVVDRFHHHFIQDLLDHAKGIPNFLKDFKEIFSMCCAIPFAPHEYLHEAFRFINGEAMQEKSYDDVVEIFHHIWEKWLNSMRYDEESVSVAGHHELCSSNAGLIVSKMLKEVNLHTSPNVYFLIGSVVDLEAKVKRDIDKLQQGHLISPSMKITSWQPTRLLEELQLQNISIEEFISEVLSSLYPVLKNFYELSQL